MDNNTNQQPQRSMDGVMQAQPIDNSAPIQYADAPQPQTPQQSQATAPAPQGGDTPPNNTPKKKSKLGLILGAVLLIGGIALAGGAYVMGMDKDDNKAAETPTTTAKKTVPLVKVAFNDKVMEHIYPEIVDNDSVAQYVSNHIFEPLVRYEDKTKIVPVLATKWTNPDAKTWDFTIKTGVKFHNGNPLTAKVVKASLEKLLDNPAIGDLLKPVVATIEAPSDTQLLITTKEADPLMLNRLSNFLIYDPSVATASGNTGTGPYNIKPGATPTAADASLVAMIDYHGGEVLTKEVTFHTLADADETTKAVTAGTYDVIGTLSKANLAANSNYYALKYDAITLFALWPNTFKTNSPMQKKDVRRAVYLSIDINKFIEVSGIDAVPASQITSAEVAGYNPNVTRPERDIAEAKKLLAAAGYPNGVELSLTTPGINKAQAEELVKELAEAGITLKLNILENPNDYSKQRYTTDLSMSGYSSDLYDSSDVISATFQKGGVASAYDNADVNALMLEVNKTTDATARIATLQKITKMLMDDTAVIPLRFRVASYGVRNGLVTNVDAPTSLQSPGIYFWKVYQQ